MRQRWCSRSAAQTCLALLLFGAYVPTAQAAPYPATIGSSVIVPRMARDFISNRALTPSSDGVIRIDAGSSTNTTDGEGKTWNSDTGLCDGMAYEHTGRRPTGFSNYEKMFSTELWNPENCRIPVANGNYTVKLHFIEYFYGLAAPGERVFDVSVEGNTLFNLDVFREVGQSAPLIKSFSVTVSDGQLQISFNKKLQAPMISGIEIMPGSGTGPQPTTAPTKAPTALPTTAPTKAPTALPTTAPTKAPTALPTTAPTKAPTALPTTAPTKAPTALPTTVPTKAPTAAPTTSPTVGGIDFGDLADLLGDDDEAAALIEDLCKDADPDIADLCAEINGDNFSDDEIATLLSGLDLGALALEIGSDTAIKLADVTTAIADQKLDVINLGSPTFKSAAKGRGVCKVVKSLSSFERLSRGAFNRMLRSGTAKRVGASRSFSKSHRKFKASLRKLIKKNNCNKRPSVRAPSAKAPSKREPTSTSRTGSGGTRVGGL
jgi:Malectin domain